MILLLVIVFSSYTALVYNAYPVHFIFAFIYVLLAVGSFHFQWFDAWIAAATFCVVLALLFFAQGRRWLKA